jgi:hypothetical protein
LPRHAECCFDGQQLVALAHIRATQVRPLLDRLGDSRVSLTWTRNDVGSERDVR